MWQFVKHFKPSEFDSPDSPGSGNKMSLYFVMMLDELRKIYGKPIIISSGYRTPERNNAVRGSKGSKHMLGIAADINVAGEDAYKIVSIATELGFTGIGVNQRGDWEKRFIHLDMRKDKPTIWSY